SEVAFAQINNVARVAARPGQVGALANAATDVDGAQSTAVEVSGDNGPAGESRRALVGAAADIDLTETVPARRDSDSGEDFKRPVQALEAAVELNAHGLAALPVHAVVVVPVGGLQIVGSQRVPPVPLEMRIDAADVVAFGIERMTITETRPPVIGPQKIA